MMTSWPGNTAVHLAKETWQARYEEAFKRGDLEVRVGDEQRYRPIQVTAASNAALEWVEEVLPPLHARVIAAAMLQKDILPSGFQHSLHITQSAYGVRNGAESPGGHHAVKACLTKRERFGGDVEACNGHTGGSQALGHSLVEDRMGINRSKRSHSRGIMGEIQPCAKAYFQDMAIGRGERYTTLTLKDRLAQAPIHDVREDISCVPTHTPEVTLALIGQRTP
jgi:hypothetical protein